jgi:hypothetical protein
MKEIEKNKSVTYVGALGPPQSTQRSQREERKYFNKMDKMVRIRERRGVFFEHSRRELN